MVAVRTPSLEAAEQIKTELLECRTYAYPEVMKAGHRYILSLEGDLAAARQKIEIFERALDTAGKRTTGLVDEILAARRDIEILREANAAGRREFEAARRETQMAEEIQARYAEECDSIRERTIEEIAQFIENEPIHSWVPGILAKRIRALSTQPNPHNPLADDELLTWARAFHNVDDEQDTGSGK